MVGVRVGNGVAGFALGEAVGGMGVALAEGTAVNVALAAGSVRSSVGEACGAGNNDWQAVNSKIKGSSNLRIALIIAVVEALLKP